MVIGIIGASGVELAQMEAALKEAGHEAIVIADDKLEESKEADIRLIVVREHVLANAGVHPTHSAVELLSPTKDNSFRGGSIGKGGKIKYRRG